MNKIVISTLIVFGMLSCKTPASLVDISLKETNFPVYTILSNDTQRIVRVCFPKKIVIKNKSKENKSFIKIRYEYNSIAKSIGNFIRLYQIRDNSLMKISNNNIKTIASKNSLDYILYTVHYLDKNSNSENQFKLYLKKMLIEKKDTLHIGTVKEFKQKHKELFEKLTKNDSISIQFLDGKKYGERITVPIKW